MAATANMVQSVGEVIIAFVAVSVAVKAFKTKLLFHFPQAVDGLERTDIDFFRNIACFLHFVGSFILNQVFRFAS